MSNGTGTNKGPAHVVKLGRVQVEVWANETEHGIRYNLKPRKIYKNAQGKWDSTGSFDRNDAFAVGEAMRMAYHWALKREREAEQEDGS